MLLRSAFFALIAFSLARVSAAPDAIVIAIADEHSAYDRLPTLIALVDTTRATHPNVPLAVLINGDAFEYGNRVARRTSGKLDFAALHELAERTPTVLNIGNHEGDLFPLSELVVRAKAAGVSVITATARNRESGQSFAPATTKLSFGKHTATIVGFTTDALATYHASIRPTLDLQNPVTWARTRLREELANAEIPIVLSHAGLRADRAILGEAPRGTLFIGGHDHIRLVHAADTVTYVHTGSWLESVTIAELQLTANGPKWSVRQIPLTSDLPKDGKLSAEVQTTIAATLSADDKRVVGHAREAMDARAAARFAVESARRAAGADVAIIGATTFGDGLPTGEVSAYALDNCVRFDGPLYIATVTGDTARELLRRANQGPDTPFAERTGENLIATTAGDLGRATSCRIVTTDWIGRNPKGVFGENAPKFTELSGVTLKAAVIAALRD